MAREEKVKIKIDGSLKVVIKQVEAAIGVKFTNLKNIATEYTKKAPAAKGRYELQYRKKYSVGLSNICYTILQKIKESLLRRFPVQRSHGKTVVFKIVYV